MRIKNHVTCFRVEWRSVPFPEHHAALCESFDFSCRTPPSERDHLDWEGEGSPQYRDSFGVVDQDDELFGRSRDDLFLQEGAAAARACAVNVLAALKAELGELSRVRRVVKVTVFVAGEPDFCDQPKVANGASELFGEVFGEAGRHARAAVGVAALPLGVPVEVDAIAEVG